MKVSVVAMRLALCPAVIAKKTTRDYACEYAVDLATAFVSRVKGMNDDLKEVAFEQLELVFDSRLRPGIRESMSPEDMVDYAIRLCSETMLEIEQLLGESFEEDDFDIDGPGAAARGGQAGLPDSSGSGNNGAEVESNTAPEGSGSNAGPVTNTNIDADVGEGKDGDSDKGSGDGESSKTVVPLTPDEIAAFPVADLKLASRAISSYAKIGFTNVGQLIAFRKTKSFVEVPGIGDDYAADTDQEIARISQLGKTE